MAWGKLVSMELDDDDKLDLGAMIKNPTHPPGLRICLCGPQLEKLGLEADCEVGDMIDIRAFATVTSCHKEENDCRVELQITNMAVENEMTEDEDDGD